MEPSEDKPDKQQQQKLPYDLTGLSIPPDNHFKKMSREALERKVVKLLQESKQLHSRLAFLEPHKQRQYKQPNPTKTERLFRLYKRKRFALKIAYIGVSYNGLTIQKSTDNTVETHLFKAMRSVGAVQELEPGEDYTRAGRTDTGVSAFGNVVSLFLRTNEPIQASEETPLKPPIDYCELFNRQLPSDIRVLSVREVPQDFNARYWCTERSYKYFFLRNHLDLEKMHQAIAMFRGTHNFINFCRIDVVATTNYERNITTASIERVDYLGKQAERDQRNELYYFHFIGNAFLWHQIRFMATILFLVGSGKEQPEIVRELLDPVKYPKKPNYPISPEYPLILEECRYKDIKFDVQKSDAIAFYNTFNQTVMKKIVELCLYTNSIREMCRWLTHSNPPVTQEQLLAAAEDETLKMQTRKAAKKLSLHKSTCIGVQEAISNLKGRRLELFEKRTQKQLEYEERVRRTNEEVAREIGLTQPPEQEPQ